MPVKTVTMASRPYTVYAAALLYKHKHCEVRILFSRIFLVSGDNPLTEKEAVARAAEETKTEWHLKNSRPEDPIDPEDYQLVQSSVSWNVVR